MALKHKIMSIKKCNNVRSYSFFLFRPSKRVKKASVEDHYCGCKPTWAWPGRSAASCSAPSSSTTRPSAGSRSNTYARDQNYKTFLALTDRIIRLFLANQWASFSNFVLFQLLIQLYSKNCLGFEPGAAGWKVHTKRLVMQGTWTCL